MGAVGCGGALVLAVCLCVFPLGTLAQESCAGASTIYETRNYTSTIVPPTNSAIDFGLCGADLAASLGNKLFKFVPYETGTYTLDACTDTDYSGFSLSVLSGTCDSLTCLTPTEDCAVSFSAVEGETYYFLLHGSSSLDYKLVFSYDSTTHPCNFATSISLGVNTVENDTAADSRNFLQNSCGSYVATSLGFAYYRFLVPATGRYKIRTESGHVVTFKGTCDSPSCLVGPSCQEGVIYLTSSCPKSQEVIFEAESGEDLLVVIRGITTTMSFEVEVSEFDLDVTPCLDHTDVFLDTPLAASAVGGSPSNFASCGTIHDSDASDVFFRFVTPKEGLFSVDTCNTTDSFMSNISVYSSGCEAPQCLSEDGGSCGSHSVAQFSTVEGTEVLVMVHSYGSTLGDFTLNLEYKFGCADAPELGVGTITPGSTQNNGYSTDFPNCVTRNYDGRDALYTFTPSEKGYYQINTCSDIKKYDTQLSIFRGTCNSYSCMTGNDDSCGLYSSVDFLAEAGEQFIVMVHGYGGVDVEFNVTTKKLSSDQLSCEDAFPILLGEPMDGDTGLGFFSDIPECGVSNDPWSPEVFYTFIAPAAGSYQVDTCGTASNEPTDTKISVFSGGCDEQVCVGGNDDGGADCGGFRSLVKFDAVEAGQEFLIMVHAFRRNSGPFTLTVSGTKDLCSLAREITLGPYIVGNTTSDGISNSLSDCGVTNRDAPDTFFRFVAPASKIYAVDTCGLDTTTDTKVSIYGFCGSICLNGNDDSGCGYFKSKATFLAGEGSEYLIRVEPFDDNHGGEFSIEIYESEASYTEGPVKPQEPENRPQLLDSSLHIREAQVMNHQFEYAQATLDFDQKIYLNEPLMCPFAERGCDPLPGACEECEWGDVLAACWGSDCCSEPCEVEDEGFIQVPLNGESDLILLNTSDSQYFRFVLDNVSACAPLQVSVATEYGNAQLLVSNVKAFPEWEDRLDDDKNLVFGYVSSDPTFHYSQASLTLCPSSLYDQGYDHAPGIYSVGVFALENTAFRLEISVGMQHPIPQPAERVSCDDVPEIEFAVARGKEGDIHDVLCLEDSVTKVIHLDYPVVDLSNQVILPFPAGCHVATLTATGYLYGERNEYEPADVYCFPTVENDLVQINTSTIGRRKKDRDVDAVTFAACSDKPFFVHCSYYFWKTEYYTLLFSSTVVPKRTPLIDVRPGPLAMSRGIGAVAATMQGEAHQPCVDWQKNCNEFLTPAITDPQPLWPPPGDMWIVKGHFDFPLPPDRMVELDLAHKVENRVTFIKYLSKANNQLMTSERLVDRGSLSIIALTNENGDPLMLPNDGKRNQEKRQDSSEQPQSFLDYVPNIAYSSLEVGFFPVCDLEKYETHQKVVQEEILKLLPATTFEDVIPSQYIIEVYNDAYARTSCVAAAASFLDTERSLTVIRGQTGCQYSPDSSMWAEDPCCNPAVVPLACCAPYSNTVEEYVYSGADLKQLDECGVHDCAESYINDLSDTLNTFTDPITGCASGVLRPEDEMRAVVDGQLDKTLRECALEVGLGDPFRSGFTGVECAEDSDCPSDICNRYLGTCALPDYQETEDHFLSCFISRMSSLTEDYLRENVFPESKELEIARRESPEFLAAVRAAAAHMDCVNTENALDFSQMTHKQLSVPSDCSRDYVLTLSPYTDYDLVNKLCPTQYCLGDICRFDNQNCYEGCAELSDFESSNSSCLEASRELELTCSIGGVDCDGTFSCVFCPEDGSACEVVESVDSQDECESMFMCVLPNGTRFVTDNEDECQSHSECSVDCAGAQCRGKAPGRGVCLFSRPEGVSYADCVAKGGINTNLLSEADPICVLKDISTQQDCLLDPDFIWDTCESLDVDSCTYENFSPGQVFLGCAVDIFRTCESEEECEDSGRCSDLGILRQIASESFDAEDPVPSKESRGVQSKRQAKGEGIQNGVCLTSGTHLVTSISASRIPYCAFGQESSIGCIEDVEEEDCNGPVDYFGSFKRWRTWVTPALNEEECTMNTFGHSGCQLPGETFHQWGWNMSDCQCRLGTYGNTWTWTPGQWVSGEVRPLKWMAAENKTSVYEYRETIDFWTLSDWVQKSSVQQFTDSVKSQIICEANLMTSSLETILCDCVDNDEDDSCYEASTSAIEVGIRDVCEGEVSVLKGPSNNILFDETAVKERCTEVKLGMLRKSAFAVSRETASVSFQFEAPEKPGVVLNEKGATVGVLFGDGAVLTFEKPKIVRHFRACLRVTVDQKAKVRDFGYTTGTTITPLGLNAIEVKEESLIEFWCATLNRHEIPTDSDGSIKIFPVSLSSSNWEDENDQDYSDSTIALVYTLGALYTFDFLLLSFFLLHLFFQVTQHNKAVPVVAWIGVLLTVLCVFRIVFCFLWPVGGFGDNSLAEYVVFEIPTFLLFSIVILSISFFRKLSRTGTFFVKENDKSLTIATAAAIFLVWCLFAVVAIVYAEVILEDNEATSECPGRVEAESDFDEQTRTLSIVYQSIVIVFTFILATVFFYSSWCLFKLTQRETQASTFVFRLGAILVTAFVARCILFMVLLALDFTSAVYLFCTLFFTEVLMIFLIQLEFNKHFYNKMATTLSSRVGSSRSGTTNGTNGKTTAYDMDD